MIYKEGKEITAINVGEIPIVYVYKGDTLVWQALKSCFSTGKWVEDYPWLDDSTWKDE